MTTINSECQSPPANAPLAAVAGAEPGTKLRQVSQDEELIALGAVFLRERDYYKALPGIEQESDASYDRYWAAIDRMADVPSQSLAGLSVKAKTIREYSDNSDMVEFLVDSLIDDVIRLAGGVA